MALAGKFSQVAHLRLTSQRILGHRCTDVVNTVRSMLAMQAQDFAGAKWSVGLRTEGATDGAVEQALASGEIVRSWPLRGTLHFCAAEDLLWLLEVGARRVIAGAAARRAALGIDERTLGRVRDLAIENLAGGRGLTRAAILEAFERGGLATAGQRGYHLLWHLSQTGTLCFGPPRGKARSGQRAGREPTGSEQTFVLLEEWVKHPLHFEREQALGELARRYFASHGPATSRDLAWWAKLTAADLATAIAVARPALTELTSAGFHYFMAGEAAASMPRASAKNMPLGTDLPSVFALPGFDEYLLGYQNRDAALPLRHRSRIVPGGNGMFMPTIVVDGQVVGTWRSTARAKVVDVEALPFTRLTRAAAKGFAAAVQARGRFLGAAVRVIEKKAAPRSPAGRRGCPATVASTGQFEQP